MTKRSFLKKLLGSAALVAVAPQVALKARDTDFNCVTRAVPSGECVLTGGGWMPVLKPHQLVVFCGPEQAKAFYDAFERYQNQRLGVEWKIAKEI